MSKEIRINTGIQTYNFVDEDDHVFASFKLNPTDVNLAARALEVGEYFQNLKEKKTETIDDVVDLNREFEEKIAYVLGYKPEELFGEVTATTIFADGRVFAILVIERILEETEPALRSRQEKFDKAAAKYLSE